MIDPVTKTMFYSEPFSKTFDLSQYSREKYLYLPTSVIRDVESSLGKVNSRL